MVAINGRLLANQEKAINAVLGNDQLPPQAHPGLVFDRYLRLWNSNMPPELMKKTTYPKRNDYDQVSCLNLFAEDFNKSQSKKRLKLLHDRQENYFKQKSLFTYEQETISFSDPLALGLGNAHPLGNGFVFDPVSGVPYLSGSSIKGLIRAAGKYQLSIGDIEHWLVAMDLNVI